MPWMVIKGDKKPRQLNEHTENKTDLKKTCRKKKVAGMIILCLGSGYIQKNIYQHPSECKRISANMQPYGVKGMEEK